MKKHTIAIIGCGRIANHAHLPALSGRTDVTIRYACDLIAEKAEAAVRRYGCEQAITDYRVALADPEVEAVWVLTPNAAHYTVTMDALRAGKHVFCEKPITTDYARACEMAEEARRQGRLLNIGVCNRYHRSVEMIAALNAAGKLGHLYHVYCSFRSYRSIPGLGGAFTTASESGGGVLIDWGIHFLDLILYVLGGARLRSATCDTYREMAKNMEDYVYTSMWAEDTKNLAGTNDVEDGVSGYIRTDSASISFNGAWAQNIGEEDMFIDFMGDKGGVRLRYGGDFDWWTVEDGTLVKKHPIYKIPDMYRCEDDAFLQATETGEHTRTHVDAILESARLLQALYDSAAQGHELQL